VGQLGFLPKSDEIIKGERFVVVMPPCLTEFAPICSLRFRQAVTERDMAAVGNQAGDGVFLQIESDDWDTLYDRLRTIGAVFVNGHVRKEHDYRAVTVQDPMGNQLSCTDAENTVVTTDGTRADVPVTYIVQVGCVAMIDGPYIVIHAALEAASSRFTLTTRVVSGP
jgi:hypothetical protein